MSKGYKIIIAVAMFAVIGGIVYYLLTHGSSSSGDSGTQQTGGVKPPVHEDAMTPTADTIAAHNANFPSNGNALHFYG